MSSAEAVNPADAVPSTGLSDAIRTAGVLPIVVNEPPIYTWSEVTATARTTLLGQPNGFQALSAPVLVSNAAIRRCVFPPTVVKFPTAYRRDPSGDCASPNTSPFTAGAKDVGKPVVASMPARFETAFVCELLGSWRLEKLPPR